MTRADEYVEQLARAARRASRRLVAMSADEKSRALERFARELRASRARILDANAGDVAAAQTAGLVPALIERLKLDEMRLEAMARGVEQIAAQRDPVGETIESLVRPDGLRIEKRRVPIGVVLFFYESRPNVTADAAALCIKSGNAVILRGGKEAIHTNRAIIEAFRSAIAGLPASADRSSAGSSSANGASMSDAVQFIDNADRSLVPVLLKLDKYIDLVIPRGGESLIRAVVAESTIPVLKHFTGNCHLYIDASARDMERTVRDVCVNAKTSYPGGVVCNAVEHLIFHRDAQQLVPNVCADLAARGVTIRGDERVRELYVAAEVATPKDWDTEYLDLVIGIKIVDSLDEAIEHINEHGSHHTDGIISHSRDAIEQFVARVDSASVMVNASTRLADGAEYGLGAEIGISTDKLHARGPMGAADLTTYKWVVVGDGHLRG
jgi:glutamate-5-semialdehyde dehydrogenase